MSVGAGLVRPDVTTEDAEAIARECYGVEVRATELGSNQDRNFVLHAAGGGRSVLRVDNPVFGDEARDAQHAALEAYRAAGVRVPAVLPGLDGRLTQRWRGFAVRRSEYAEGEPIVDVGYLAPVVLAEFGALAAASVSALVDLRHPGLERDQMWDMRVAYDQIRGLADAIGDADLRQRVLSAADEAHAVVATVGADLPVQPIHGDLTDDNTTGVRRADSRLHPHVVLDLGDLGLGWRVAELAVCASSMLHHEPERPLRVLETIAAFHERVPLHREEAEAVWPLIVLRAALLVASGWRQLAIDGANDYARERIATEQAIFDAATAVPLVEAVAHVLERVDIAPAAGQPQSTHELLPDLVGSLVVVDAGIESAELDAGRWMDADAEARLVADAHARGADVAVLPYGAFRLTRAAVDSAHPAATWPVETELHLVPGRESRVVAPWTGEVQEIDSGFRLVADPGWVLEVRSAGLRVWSAGREVGAGEEIATVASTDGSAVLVIGIRRTDAPQLELSDDGAALVTPERVPAWRRLTSDPAPLLGIRSHAERDEAQDELRRRERIFAEAQERYYERPPQIERGWRHHLIDTTGRTYVDMVNNVAGLGHAHPLVAEAASRQLRTLATNSRFLYRDLAEYSERLIALMPAGSALDTVLLVNSGSEAVDLALRLAQAATARRTVVALREAYHGWTMASDAVTTSAYDNPFALETRPDWVHVADVPNRYRGTYRGDDTADRYLADLDADLDRLAAEGRDVAAFLCESVLGNAGGVLLPDGYLAGAYERVRARGGLCIADEVQVGFGRMGSTFWGFEKSGVVPDIVTIAKPMGNGFPIGGVITSKRIADALSSQGQFFSSAGGSTLSCRVGIAVLDAMEADGLQSNAREIGDRLAAGFRELSRRHQLVGPVHGAGLYLGVELVRDRETMEPADAEAAAICERMRELGVVILATSERSNVLKVKPPLCLTQESADHMLASLDRVLSEGW
ncbi:aminotransferase [Microbacterium hydrocarbonoxydans]|uniref:aminotransferase n=1 Tax=Microbacterium hydrocarbonoxydans TaxID=273678 RepID=UPI00203A5FD7|nr:aminotransferase [Microbacterium hydrocarbonoxydans]MCM3779462.1 aminotransferase [Microbacterium hydrocarbonoxydans]